MPDRTRELLGLIADAYRRMASNTDPMYRAVQRQKTQDWLDELTKLYEQDPMSVMTDHR